MSHEMPLRLVVFPWLAFGHMMPYLELAKSLAKRGHCISFVSTPANLRRLRPAVPPHLLHFIHFVSFPLPPTQGLPPSAEATSDVAPHEVQYLKKAFDGLRDPFARFLDEASPKPDWIIVDFAPYWAPPLASRIGIPCMFFSIFIGAFLSFLGPVSELKTADGHPRCTADELARPRKWYNFTTSVACRSHEATQIFAAIYVINASGLSDVDRYARTVEGCDAVAIRTCDELEPDWLDLLREIHRKAFIPVGLVPPESGEDDCDSRSAEAKMIFEWLDGQQPRSVVYVAFGSEATLSAELVGELALGLELSGMPFLWALRRPVGLPEGFRERTKGRGVVANGWIPQLKVLAHASLGGFLTHCGWSSVIESLQHGHPLVLLPISIDQGINARVMEERRIGLAIPRSEDGSFTKEAVATALRLVVVEDEGEELRAKAKEMRGFFGDKNRDESCVDGFVEYLKKSRHQNLDRGMPGMMTDH